MGLLGSEMDTVPEEQRNMNKDCSFFAVKSYRKEIFFLFFRFIDKLVKSGKTNRLGTTGFG